MVKITSKFQLDKPFNNQKDAFYRWKTMVITHVDDM